ncbi:ABC transporter with ATpase domain plus 3 transmembrane regions [Cryptosporidium sp. chipmunk genotype I]|uniref:ABC transporter with ATpase domain plus 3 transmembrane regions n=1 Tax=Cryptosporidium sp. chipmunk genotype I TaxID=1280935 RepID=UPI00351A0479|nr:ABC transporter with ATpase domain plus 3 transmembrane regions [Cryptosporidium sp. chipmunk genotype I]
MELANSCKHFFNKCSHSIHLKLNHSKKIINGTSEIFLESETELPNKIFIQTPSLLYCNIISVEINGINFEGWSINPVPTLEDSNKIVGHNVFDIATLQMAYGFISSNYGEISPDQYNVIENRLLISISDEKRLNIVSNDINENQYKYSIIIKVNFELLINSPKSPINYVIENDDLINISIIPNVYSKLPWFPTLSSVLYLTENTSPFWNSPWIFKCTVPDGYSAIMPGFLKTSSLVNEANKIDENTFEYSYDSGKSFPHLYPNNVVLLIGKYRREDKTIGKNTVSIFRPTNISQTVSIANFVVEIIEGYEKLLNNTLPMKSIIIVFSKYHIINQYSHLFTCHGRVSDSLSKVEMLSNASPPLLYQENNYYSHLSETDIGITIGNVIIVPLDILPFEKVPSNILPTIDIKKNNFQDNFRMQIKTLTAPIIILLDRLASLWFGSYIHITNLKRLPADGWMLLGMKRYLMRQMAKKLCGEDLVKCRMKEALERCLLLIENGNDYIPLSVKDFYINLQQNGTPSFPLVNWNQRECQTLFRLKSDIVFHSLQCYVNQMIKSKARKVGFGFSDFDFTTKQNSQSKLFNIFIQSFINKHCIKKNHRNFTTQHFFLHIASCISQQFIHRSKKEIATAQLPQHEQYLLNEIQDELLAFRSAWVEGVGCPNLTITSTFQFSNKNTFLDHALFTVDQTPLQPPHLTSKEGISSFIPLVSIFRVKRNIFPRNDIEKLIFDCLSFIDGVYSNVASRKQLFNSITKLLPSFLWPHDPNNIILKESNITILGLGNTGRIPIPIKFGFGPLFDSVFQDESLESTKRCANHPNNKSNFERLVLDNNLTNSTQPDISGKKKNYSASSNGGITSWQFGYMNILCQILLKYYEPPLKSVNDIEWLCTELASHIPISGGTGKFWPGHTLIYIVQSEENKNCELETIEPQLPVSQEIKFETQKIKSGYKRDAVPASNSSITSSVCVQGVTNNQNSLTHTNIKMNEVPRLSLLHDLQQRKHFVGKLSNSDNIWLQPLKFSRNYKEIIANEEEQFSMNRMLNSVNFNAHLLWTVVDSSQYWLAKISRYQTWSMWDQQFLNETDVIGQFEAAYQLGMERYIFGDSSVYNLTILERAFQSLNILMSALYHFDWNVFVRKKALISIIKIHNKLSSQVSTNSDIQPIKTAVFSFIKKFIFELASLIGHRNNKELSNLTSNVFFLNELEILLFSIKSLSYLWNFEADSSSFEVLYFLSELLDKHTNPSHDQFNTEILCSIFEAIEKIVLPISNSQYTSLINKITSTISKLIACIPKNYSYIYENARMFGILFRILSKHPINILSTVSNEFRNDFGIHFDPLWFIDLPFTYNNAWWDSYSSIHGSVSRPLYKLDDPVIQINALRCYFSLSLQGFTEIMVVSIEDNLGKNIKFKSICPEIIYDMIFETFFECNKQANSQKNITSTCGNKKSGALNIIGIFNVWNFKKKEPKNIVSAHVFPRNLLKTLCVCTLIHIILYNGIQESLKVQKNNSNYWKIINSLWSVFICTFDDIIRDFPHLLDEFILLQAHAEFEPLINSLTNKQHKDRKTIDDIKQCCIFISQIILNSPISLSSYPFDPLIFQNISNIYVSLFGHGVPVCMSQPPFISENTKCNQLIFNPSNGYILSGIPEVPMKESLRKRQKFIKRGCELSDSIQIRRLCDDESYILSRGWKHMCKKITQCLIESPYGAPFIHPVDESDAPDYYNLIEQPIDLSTIMNKIKQDLYESIEHYRSDVDLIFTNCKKYNESTSLIVDWCNKIHSEFDQLFKPKGSMSVLYPNNSSGNENSIQDNEREIYENAKKRQIDYAVKQGIIGSVRMVWGLCYAYFTSNGSNKSIGKPINLNRKSILSKIELPKYKLLLTFLLILSSSIVSYYFSVLIGSFWSALETKNQKKFHRILFYYFLMLIINGAINCARTDISIRIQIDLRMWLTDLILKQYYSDLTYYQFSINKTIDNPDQRIGEDISLFSSHLLLLICRCIDNFFDLLVYSILLYNINFKLFISAVIYSFFGTVFTAKLGMSIILLKVQEKKLESDFRYSIMRVGENAENVAMYGGAQCEMKKHKQILNSLLLNLTMKRSFESKMGLFGSIFRNLIRILPVAVISGDYFSGNIQLGRINQCSLAFNSIVEDISILVNTFREISNLLSSIDRIGHFIVLMADNYIESQSTNIGEKLISSFGNDCKTSRKIDFLRLENEFLRQVKEKSSEFRLNFASGITLKSLKNCVNLELTSIQGRSVISLSGKIRSVIWSEPKIKFENVSIYTPEYSRKLFFDVNFMIEQSDKVLITGDSGVGKSSLLKVISGIWKNGSGNIYKPPSCELLFIPQKPYCTQATLREQLFYPKKPSIKINGREYKDKEELDSYLLKILEDVGLKHLSDRLSESETGNCLDSIKDWSTILSLGEQQRLAFARIFIFNPSICFLDEATSALDMETEAKLYSILNKKKLTDIINEIKKNEYITEISYHSSGDRLVIADIKQNLHIFDLLPTYSNSDYLFKLIWVETSTLYDSSIVGTISRISWAPECFGQLFVAGTTKKNITIWSETRKGYQDTYHMMRNNIIFENESSFKNDVFFNINNGSSWKLTTAFSPFKGSISNIKFACKDHGLIFAACDSNGIVGIFTCNDMAMKVEWELETLKVRKTDHFVDLDIANMEEHYTCLDWIPYHVSSGIGITVAISNHIYIFKKKSKFWNCVETITVNNAGIIKDISWSKLALFSDYYKLASLHEENTLITWKSTDSQSLNDLGKNKTISQLNKFESIGSIERIYWHPLGQILACIGYDGHLLINIPLNVN